MNDELKNQLAKAVEKGIALAEKTGEFVIDQVPDLVHQFLLWHAIDYSVWLVVGLILLVGVNLLTKQIGVKQIPEHDADKQHRYIYRLGRYFKKEYEYDTLPNSLFLSFFIRVMGYVLVFSMIIQNVLGLLKIWIAPKIYLIEYFINQ